MMVYVMIALVWVRPFGEKPDSGIIQMEFDTLQKCEAALKKVDEKFNTSKLTCLEIQK